MFELLKESAVFPQFGVNTSQILRMERRISFGLIKAICQLLTKCPCFTRACSDRAAAAALMGTGQNVWKLLSEMSWILRAWRSKENTWSPSLCSGSIFDFFIGLAQYLRYALSHIFMQASRSVVSFSCWLNTCLGYWSSQMTSEIFAGEDIGRWIEIISKSEGRVSHFHRQAVEIKGALSYISCKAFCTCYCYRTWNKSSRRVFFCQNPHHEGGFEESRWRCLPKGSLCYL